MIKIAIVEDDKNSELELEKCLNDFFNDKNLEIDITYFENGQRFIDNFNCEYNLIFMDISMPGINGMETAEKIREFDKEVLIIFITSLAQYALKGYKVNAFDYILKPYKYNDLNMTLLRVLPMLKVKDNYIVIKTNSRESIKINLNDLLYIEVMEHYLTFKTTDNEYKVHDSLGKYSKQLSDKGFAECNRSDLVNLKKVKKIKQNVVVIGEDELIIARTKRKEFLSRLNNYISLGI